MSIVSAIPEKCKRCYVCVRECPAKAIKVEHGQALVIRERCIACGNCVKVCSQQAKRIQDDTGAVRDLLRSGRPTVACLAPSFPAAFHQAQPGRTVAAVRALGFREVWNAAFGAECVAAEYARLFEKAKRSRTPVITTPCPALVSYVEKFLPALRPALAPVVSPMVATARAIRQRLGPGVAVVFIGPCIAKKNEIRDPSVRGCVDYVLTFEELETLFADDGLDPLYMPSIALDGPAFCIGAAFPLSAGLLRSAGVLADVLDNDIVVAEGKDRALVALRELAEGASRARFLDVLFCEGCISGPRMLNHLGHHARKERLADYVKELRTRVQPADLARGLIEFRDLDLGRTFAVEDLSLPFPDEAAIDAALRTMHKFRPEDHLNCGACGYHTCREKAVAACQGLAEPSMCLPYLIDEIGETLERLQASQRDLEEAQHRLVHSERMASMGQLSAGVAHEINNPLGTVLIYAHMLLRHMKQDDPARADLELIVSEATRCKTIVRGLLDFARQSRVSKEPTDLGRVIREVLTIMAPRAEAAKVRLRAEVDRSLPMLLIDGGQTTQMLVNLVGNGIDACREPGGEVAVLARFSDDYACAVIDVADNGGGIPADLIPKVFTPFFTTKELGKGTGLGLAICYGIVKMHAGDITVASTEGRGTVFTVTLPIEDGP